MPVEIKYRLEECLNDPEMFCSSLLLVLLDHFGSDVLKWEPEVLKEEVDRISSRPVSQLATDKMNAALCLLQNNLYHRSLPAFTTINSVFSSKCATPDSMQICSVDDILWGCTEVQLIEGPEDFKAQGFSHPIRHYVGMLLDSQGVTKPPTLLEWAEFDEDRSANQEITFADDPDMSMAYTQRQGGEVDRMNSYVVQNLVRLMMQYKKLPLANAQDFSSKVGGMLKNLSQKAEEHAA